MVYTVLMSTTNLRTTFQKKSAGFTLIELLIVIGILMILMAGALIAINPFRQFAQANDDNRWNGVTTIMNAVYQNVIDNRGTFDCALYFPNATTTMGSGVGQYNICPCLVPTYIGAMPRDPQNGNYTDCTSYDTGYDIYRDSITGRVTILASSAQTGTIQITR